MKKMYLLSTALTLSLGTSLSQGSEVVSLYPQHGYRPATERILNVIPHAKMTSPLPHMTASSAVTPIKLDKPIQLAQIPNWPSALIYDQGNFGSCTANSAGFAIRYTSNAVSKNFALFDRNPEMLSISRFYQYYNTRFYESKIHNETFDSSQDTGCSIAGSILALDKYGCCPEKGTINEESIHLADLWGNFVYKGWDYLDENFPVQPDPDSYHMAYDRDLDGLNDGTPFASENMPVNPYAHVSQALQYKNLTTPFRKADDKIPNTPEEMTLYTNSVIAALQRNHVVMTGVMLDDSFGKDQRGYIPTPALKTFKATGGHAISIVGYGRFNQNNPKKNYFKFINSWSPTWGDGGFGYFEDNYAAQVNPFSIESYEVWLNPATK